MKYESESEVRKVGWRCRQLGQERDRIFFGFVDFDEMYGP